jgi:hypothetical protein
MIIMPDASSKAPSLSKVDEDSFKDESDGNSTSGLSTSTGGKKENEEGQVLETRCLHRSRCTVLVLLTVVAAVAGALTFVLSTEGNEVDFESRVRNECFQCQTRCETIFNFH